MEENKIYMVTVPAVRYYLVKAQCSKQAVENIKNIENKDKFFDKEIIFFEDAEIL